MTALAAQAEGRGRKEGGICNGCYEMLLFSSVLRAWVSFPLFGHTRSRSSIWGHYCGCSSAAPSLLSSLSFSPAGFAMTFSNCDQRPSTWENSLPTCSVGEVQVSMFCVAGAWFTPHRDHAFETAIQFVHVLQHILHSLCAMRLVQGRPTSIIVSTHGSNVSNQNVPLLLKIGLLARRAVALARHRSWWSSYRGECTRRGRRDCGGGRKEGLGAIHASHFPGSHHRTPRGEACPTSVYRSLSSSFWTSTGRSTCLCLVTLV